MIYRPDTCPGAAAGLGCAYEYEGGDNWTGVVTQVHRRCAAHARIADPETLRQTIKAENQRKNVAHDAVLTALNVSRQADAPDPFVWQYDATRRLQVGVAGRTLSPAERTALQAALDTRLGAGTVDVL